MDAITDDDIRRTVSSNAFDAGLDYQRNGLVKEVRVAPDRAVIEAWVRGSVRAPYQQTIRITQQRDSRPYISGACTCPVGFNCKHVAAALFAYQEKAGSGSPPLAATSPGPGASFKTPSKPPRQAADTAARPPPPDLPLPFEVDTWLRSLDAAQEVESEHYPATVRKRLLYVVDRAPPSGRVTVDLRTIDLRRGGTGETSRRYLPPHLDRPDQLPRFLRPSDRIILKHLARSGAETSDSFIDALRGILATGRGRWGAWDGPVLTEGDLVQGALTWVLADDGTQRPQLALPGTVLPLRLAVPWYADPHTGVMGPVETALPARLVQAMLASSPLTPEMADRAGAPLAAAGVAGAGADLAS